MISLIRASWQTELRVPMFVGLSTDGYPNDRAVINGARIYYMDTEEEYEYDAENVHWYLVPSGGTGEAERILEEIKELAKTITGSVGIDDTVTGSTTTWSSNKISAMLTITDIGNGDIVFGI